MKLMNKISTYSLVTAAGLALTMSIAPDQAHSQAFKLGQSQTNIANTTNAANARGQSFNFTVAGNLASTNRSAATLQSIKFALNTNVAVTPNSFPPFVAYLYNLTVGGLPTTAALNGGGTGSIATSAQATAITADTEFTGAALTSLTFTFASTPELATTDTYAVFFSRGIDFITAAGATDAIRGSSTNTYTGGVAFRDGATNPLPEASLLTDSAFIVSATAVPFEFEASGGMAILGGLFLANKIRKRNLETKNEEQA